MFCCKCFPLCIKTDGSRLCSDRKDLELIHDEYTYISNTEPVFITKDLNKLRHKLERAARNERDGVATVILCDWDRTITKWKRSDGSGNLSCYTILENNELISKDDIKYFDDLTTEHLAIEFDPNIPMDTKIKSMNEWMEQGLGRLIEIGYSKNIIAKVLTLVGDNGVGIRKGFEQFLKNTLDKKRDFVIFSAGLKDVIMECLHVSGFGDEEYLHVVGNEFIYPSDSRDVLATAIKKPFITPFNKFKNPDKDKLSHTNKNAVICIGDSLGDLEMKQSVDNPVSELSIGLFCKTYPSKCESDIKALNNYLESFDVLMMNDPEWHPMTTLLDATIG